jgi:hypothetical protein
MARLLERYELVHTHDIGKVLVLGQVIPWLIAGFVFGAMRGKRIASRMTWLQGRGVIVSCTAGSIFVCVYAILILFRQ